MKHRAGKYAYRNAPGALTVGGIYHVTGYEMPAPGPARHAADETPAPASFYLTLALAR